MFGFLKTKKPLPKKADIEEAKVLEALKASLGDEPPLTTVLKSRLRIIDLEDKVSKLEKEIKKLIQTLSVRKYRLKANSNKKVQTICVTPITSHKK